MFRPAVLMYGLEYFYLPAPRTKYASEFGHLIRVTSIHAKIEHLSDTSRSAVPSYLNIVNDHLFFIIDPEPATWVADHQQYLQVGPQPLCRMTGLTVVTQLWADNLPEHLRYNEENLQMQLSMLETSSNSGAWCFCVMHVIHTNCALALNAVN